jgi:hypothetical protein
MTDQEYDKVHDWIKAQRGPASRCAVNTSHRTTHHFHWANISRDYRYDVEDWIELCPMCHTVFDQRKMTVAQLIERDLKRQQYLKLAEEGRLDFSLPEKPKSQESVLPPLSTKRRIINLSHAASQALRERRLQYLREKFGEDSSA